jgi:hypothetical protein
MPILNEKQTHDVTTQHAQLNNLHQHEVLAELGKEGHLIIKDQFTDRSFGVFTSGGDAQGTQ